MCRYQAPFKVINISRLCPDTARFWNDERSKIGPLVNDDGELRLDEDRQYDRQSTEAKGREEREKGFLDQAEFRGE
jgi:hypothetical protein